MATLWMTSLLFLLSAVPCIGAVPPGNLNKTVLRTEIAPAWVKEPDERGTWNIIYSCLLTLGLCVYTAIHLNVPTPGEPPRKQFLRRVKWALVAVFAPELGVFCAWQQWSWAKKVAHDLNKCEKQLRSDEEQAFPSTTVDEFDEQGNSVLQVLSPQLLFSPTHITKMGIGTPK
jgi:hypothetical protein